MVFKNKKEKCKYAWGDHKCGKPTLPNDEHCIFHSKDIEGKKDKFDEKFWKEFKRQKKRDKEYDFAGFIFPGDIQFKQLEFEKDVCFGDVTFSGKVNFLGAKFSGKAVFNFAKFYGKVNNFSLTKFSKFADFVRAEFLKESGETLFTGAEFFDNASFSLFKFRGKVSFREVKFHKRAEFQRTGYADEDVNNLSFENTYFYNVRGLFEFIEENKKKFKYSKKPKLEFLPEKFYLILGEETTARYPLISRQIKDDMYLMDKKERISKKRGIPKIWNKLFYFLWWLTADYGRSFKRWLLCCFVIIFIFGAIFADYSAPDWKPKSFWHFFSEINPQFQISPETRNPTLFTPYYFSIVTFTTLGFGDVTPLNLAGEICLAIEVLLGYIMLGGLISILANKLARRS